MRDWNELVADVDQVTLALNQVAHFQIDLRLLMHLRSLFAVAISDVEKEKRIRHVIAIRSAVLHQSSMDYTFYPQHPINLFYMRLGTALRSPDEALCQIVVPHIFEIIGTGFHPEDLKLAEGNFSPALHLSHTRLGRMISLPDMLAYAESDTQYFFQHGDEDKAGFDLTAEDRKRIRDVAPPASQHYVDAIAKMDRVRRGSKPSVGSALYELAVALLKSSKMGSGTETRAYAAELDAPLEYTHQWWMALPHDIKNEIKELKLENGKFSLESYLLCLFLHHEHIAGIVLSENEKLRVSTEMIVPCSHLIGEQLHEMVRKHQRVLNIPLPGMEAEFQQVSLPDAETMKQLAAAFEKALIDRSHASFGNDALIAEYDPIVGMLMSGILRDGISSVELNALAHYVVDLKKLVCVLTVLPEEHWSGFFDAAKTSEPSISTLFFEFFPDEDTFCDTSQAFIFLLENLSENKWATLFRALFDAKLKYFFDASCLRGLFDAFPESKWPRLVASLGRLRENLIPSTIDLLQLFPTIDKAVCSKIRAFFHVEIARILDLPNGISALFAVANPDTWGDVYTVFADDIRPRLVQAAEKKTLSDMFPPKHTNFFATIVLSDSDYMVNNKLLLASLLKKYEANKWEIVFDEMSDEQFTILIPHEHALVEFLMLFDSDEERIRCVKSMVSHLSDLKINLSQFRHLIATLPVAEEWFFLIFQFSLKDMLKEYIAASSGVGRVKLHVMSAMKKSFAIFFEKALPLILANRYIGFMCDSFLECVDKLPSDKTEGLAWIYHHLLALENMEKTKQAIPTEIALQKLMKLSHYCYCVEKGFFKASQLYNELTAHYGKDFFSDLLAYYRHFLSPQQLSVRGFGMFPAIKNETCKTAPQEKNGLSTSVNIQTGLPTTFQLKGLRLLPAVTKSTPTGCVARGISLEAS